MSTGASADFSSATRIAEDMVMSYGMSEEVGVRTFHGQSDPDPRSIKVVDEAGELVKHDAKGLLSVKELSTVVVEGKAQRDAAGNLTVLASGVFVKTE